MNYYLQKFLINLIVLVCCFVNNVDGRSIQDVNVRGMQLIIA